MDADRLERLKEILLQVLEAPEDERDACLDRLCEGDEELRREALSLLAMEGITSDLIRTSGALDEQETVAPPYDPSRTTLTDAPAARSAASGAGGGDRIGPYLLKRKLGEGGMGVVYEALQERPLRRKVALKLIKPGMDSRQVLARFDSERQALALMNHSNIAKVLDAGTTEGGQPYFVMEYVQGDSITTS